PAQVFLLPSQPFQLLLHDSLGLFLGGLPNLFSIMFRSALVAHLGQQFLAKGFAAQAPAAKNRFEFLAILNRSPQFHSGLKLLPSRRAVLGNPMLAQQPLHPQPAPPLSGPFKIVAITAPSESRELLPVREQLGPRWIQMHIVADAF